MRTRPKPSEMFLIKGSRARTVHYGINCPNVKPLCGAKLSKFHSYKTYLGGRSNCKKCIQRMKLIQKMIASLGVEWVCEGRYVPLDKRIYKDDFRFN